MIHSKSLSPAAIVSAIAGAIFGLVISQTAALLLGELAAAIGVPAFLANAIAAVLYASFFCGVVFWICKKILKTEPSAIGLTKPRVPPFWAAAAVLMPVLLCLIAWCTGGHWERSTLTAGEKAALVSSTVLYYGLAAGFVEELAFRGVLMRTLEARWGRKAAILIPSVLFGLVHLLNGAMDAASAVQLVIAGSVVGILFSLAACQTGSIWSSVLLHALWNIGTGLVHIGPAPEEAALWNLVLHRDDFFLTGGDFGIEASIIAIGIYLLFIVLAGQGPERMRHGHWRWTNAS